MLKPVQTASLLLFLGFNLGGCDDTPPDFSGADTARQTPAADMSVLDQGRMQDAANATPDATPDAARPEADAAMNDGAPAEADLGEAQPDGGQVEADVGAGSDAAPDAGPPPACPVVQCDAPPPEIGPERDWNHGIASPIITNTGFDNHRGRDVFLLPDEPQWIIGKFAYGIIDKDLKDEEIDLYLLRDCGDEWTFLGTATTTNDNDHPAIYGVEDSGGRVYFEIPNDQRLAVGRHRIHMVVAGDLSTADTYIEVVDPDTALIVTDVDGTLTLSANAEFTSLLQGELPDEYADSAAMLNTFVDRGYRVLYLSARPEWLVGRTRSFLAAKGYPEGVVQTTTSKLGEPGGGAADFKADLLQELAGRGLRPQYGFGDKETDAEAYATAEIQPAENRIFINLDGDAMGGRNIAAYAELTDEIDALPSLCAED